VSDQATSPPDVLSPSRAGAWLIAQRRFLGWGILLSVLLHIAVLAWQRTTPPAPAPRSSELEIVLVNAGTESAPSQAQLLAQVDTDGGGEAQNGFRTTNAPLAGDAAEPVVLDALVQQRQELELQQQQLLTQITSLQKVSQGRPTAKIAEANDVSGQDQADQESILLNGQIAVLNEKIQSYNARPRKHFDAPSTRKTAFAEYIDQWRQRIEEVGTEHYPAGVDGKTYGSVQATLSIRADGSIVEITINRPSDKPLLNQAVRRIAQLAAPFAPFPANMARQVDQIVLTRTWHFINGALETKQP